jgi:hypothetical protein
MRRQRWLVVAGVIAVWGALVVAGGVWSLVVDHDWSVLLGLPVTGLLLYWFGVGAYRRSRPPGRQA